MKVLWQVFFMVLGLLGIGFLIGFHEFGHFIFCKIFNVKTPTFSIGMGPRLVSKQLGSTNFILSAIPLGGYVEIAGADEHDIDPDTPSSQRFSQKPYYQKMLIIAGGILFNLIFAYCALVFLFWRGLPASPMLYPHYASREIKRVEPNSSADQANLKPGDIIKAIDDTESQNSPLAFVNYIRSHPGKTTLVTYERNGKIEKKRATIEKQTTQGKEFGRFGVEFKVPKYSLRQAAKKGLQATTEITLLIAKLFKKIFSQQEVQNLGGPLMVIQQTIKGAEKGFSMFLLILAFISINLAVLNILPIPIMDGGQALLYSIEALIRRPLPEKIKTHIKYACWIFFLALALALSIKDILHMVCK